MALVKTKALVLRCLNYREKSKIITFFTEEFGKIQCIAKGVRDTKSKFGSVLQNTSYLSIFFYHKENSTLYLLSNAEYEDVFQNIYSDMDKTMIAFKIVDLINNTTFENLKNKDIFKLCVHSLEHLNLATKNYINVFFYFEFQLAKLLGFAINLNDDKNIIVRDSSIGYKNGKKEKNKISIISYTEKYSYYNLHRREKEILRKLSDGNLFLIEKIKISKLSEKMISNFLEFYYKDHFDNLNFSKINKVIKSNGIYS